MRRSTWFADEKWDTAGEKKNTVKPGQDTNQGTQTPLFLKRVSINTD